MDELTTGRVRAAARAFAPRLVREDDAMDPGHAPAASPDPTVQAVSDSLADLFLGVGPGGRGVEGASAASPARAGPRGQGQAGEGAGPRGQSPARATIELLVLGHLPVLGTAWLGQYALHVAQARGGPVALARLEPGSASIEVFGLDRGDAVERADRLAEGVRLARARGVHWVVKVDELGEAALAESTRLDTITLLTGVGEASIVAAYRALKQIVQRAPRGGPGGEDHPDRPELRIALLGASPERAREAAARVRKAAGTFLGRGVGVVTCAERIGATGGRVLFRGVFEGDASALIEEIDRTPAERPASTGRPVAPRDESLAVDEARGASSRADRADVPSPPGAAASLRTPRGLIDEDEGWLLGVAGGASGGHAGDAGATAPPIAAVGDGCAAPRSGQSADRAEPRTTARLEASGGIRASGAVGVDGPRMVELSARLGLSALPIGCPHVPGVELAIDGGGGLHAVAMDELTVPGGPTGGRVGVAALLSAEAWINANLDLIRRALPAVSGAGVGLHLVTRIPAGVRHLLETRVRVHLLAGSDGHEVCVGLN